MIAKRHMLLFFSKTAVSLFPCCSVCSNKMPADTCTEDNRYLTVDVEDIRKLLDGHSTVHIKMSRNAKRLRNGGGKAPPAERPLVCPVCGKKFQCRGLLNRHERVHNGTLRHVCSVCGRRFTYECNLVLHCARVHAAVRPFRCPVCQKSFCRAGDLARHTPVHADRTWCGVCGKRFETRCEAKLHATLSHHTEQLRKKQVCEACCLTFATATSLDQHCAVQHAASCSSVDPASAGGSSVMQENCDDAYFGTFNKNVQSVCY